MVWTIDIYLVTPGDHESGIYRSTSTV